MPGRPRAPRASGRRKRASRKKQCAHAECIDTKRRFPSRIRAFPHGNQVIEKGRNHMAGMTKSQIAEHMAEKTGLTKKNAALFLEELASLAYKQAKNTFTFPGVGKLVLVNRKARMGRNPATGEAIKIPAKRVVKFRVAKAAKDAILGAKK